MDPRRLAAAGMLATAVLLAGCHRGISSLAPSAEVVSIVRDPAGIPHVLATTAPGAFYGVGWATAEDRLFQLELTRRVMSGRLAEVFPANPFAGALAQDMRARLIGWRQHAQVLAAALPDPLTRAILQAYADGVNDFVASRGGALPPLFGQLGITSWEPWTPADCLLAWMRFHDLLDRSWEQEGPPNNCSGVPIVDTAGAIARCPLPPDACAAPAGASPPGFRRMSHAWAVAGTHTTTGAAVLVGMPQIPVSAPSLWYEYRVNGGGFDARGIGVPGCPGMLAGWNRSIAWTVTSLGAEGGDVFEVERPANDPFTYFLDQVKTPMTAVREETIQVLGGPPVSVTHRETVFGPIVTEFINFDCSKDVPGGGATKTELALRHVALAEPQAHSVEGMLAIMASRDWCEARAALARYRGPTMHFLYADSAGHIGYSAAGAIPIRSPLSPCGGRARQDGTTAAAQWQGMIPSSSLPWDLDPPAGFLSSANNLAVDPACAPLGLVLGVAGDTVRSWRLREILSQRLGPPGSPPMTPAEVRDMHVDAVNPAVRVFAHLAVRARQLGQFAPGSTAALAALALENWLASLPPGAEGLLAAWDPFFPLVEDLARRLPNSFRKPVAMVAQYGGGESGLVAYLKAIEPDLDPPAQDPDVLAWMIPALEAAWATWTGPPEGDPGTYPVGYQDTGFLCRGPCGSSGGDCRLDPSAEFQVPVLAPSSHTIWSQPGDSTISFVDFGDLDASQSLTPPGPSEDPQSPWFQSEVVPWLAGDLVPAPLDVGLLLATASSVETVTY